MKKNLFIVAGLLAGMLAANSCIKVDTKDTTPTHVTPFDSTGIMTATANGSSFLAYSVHASKSGTMLSIVGTVYPTNSSAALSTINMHINHYFNADTTVSFNLNDTTQFLGSAGYVKSASSGGVATGAAHGIITITSAGPQLTGTFSFTCVDSTQITGGTFTTVAP